MTITITRQHFSDDCTIGELTIEGDNILLYTLEDKDRRLSQTDDLAIIKANKVFGKTAIPYGRYEVVMSYSNRFKQVMPLLLNVPGFEGIRIHAGNTSDDTEGCVLVGYQKDAANNRIVNSRPAIAELYMLINEALRNGKVWMEVKR